MPLCAIFDIIWKKMLILKCQGVFFLKYNTANLQQYMILGISLQSVCFQLAVL
jgi:hypothetical protein